ncbi:leucine-rich repeat-containing protein [Salpingoeca rosetta]|uniref:Leucine-rich repeat-containing protein n=1 Tax=Salpingoeca rosetta (strain ATCC 50818 / BSB-021) TaxID=946362 RepID=F2UIF8_SALR5|nr:leucine-rich repeat-containing protein [Salpingoeca rosetta]EGD76907.1 leucine-rich repeat-containing protein [Salpingoeca rosetta]|eukprot:XP_004991278.1 leucine-rich repeat-containing protein [Salpingoeca rosetta]
MHSNNNNSDMEEAEQPRPTDDQQLSQQEQQHQQLQQDKVEDQAQQPQQQQQQQEQEQEEQQWQQFEVKDGTLSCAYADMEEFPRVLGERYGAATTRLDLTGNDLSSLDNLELFTSLKELILDGNDLQDGFELPLLPSLETLSLNKNKLTDVSPLLAQIKAKTPNLKFLSLLWNIACPNELMQKEEEDYRQYRLQVLYQLPNLKFLDSSPVTEKEVQAAKQAGDFALRLDEDELERQHQASLSEHDPTFSPLPHKERTAEDHKGSISKCRYVYYGRHSEGNRFIRDRDL